jgi:anti-sigma B factor antagonist
MQHRPFELHVGTEGETTRLGIVGDLDVGTVPRFRTGVAEVLGTGGHQLVVDLSRTEFIDTTGMGVLLWAARRAEATGGALVTTNACAEVRRALEIAGLFDVLHGSGAECR